MLHSCHVTGCSEYIASSCGIQKEVGTTKKQIKAAVDQTNHTNAFMQFEAKLCRRSKGSWQTRWVRDNKHPPQLKIT